MMKRDNNIQDFLDYYNKLYYGRTQKESEEKGICLFCGGKVGKFKLEIYKKEYELSGMCQECQEDFFS